MWKDNEIIEGHGRLLAIMEMDDIDEVPVIRLDDLSDEERKAYTLVHNKLTMNTDFDEELLNIELEDILDIDMSEFGFALEEEDAEKEQEEPEIKFTEVIGEENNYIVLKFNTDIDWLQVETLFDLKPKKAFSTRKDGEISKNMNRVGVGRVLDGAEFLNRLGVDL